jgi:hydrogenase maturation protease
VPDTDAGSLNAPAGYKALVACVGNSLVGDDAVGCAVYDRLARRPPAGVRLTYLASSGISLLEYLSGEPLLVVVDAVQFGAAPGVVHVLPLETLPAARGPAVSAHGIGLREALEVGNLLYPGQMPRQAVLVGIEGRCFDAIGAQMTPAVARAVPRAARAVLRIIAFGGRQGVIAHEEDPYRSN